MINYASGRRLPTWMIWHVPEYMLWNLVVLLPFIKLYIKEKFTSSTNNKKLVKI